MTHDMSYLSLELRVDGIDYYIQAYTLEKTDFWRVVVQGDRAPKTVPIVVIDMWGGDCNPLRDLWDVPNYRCARGSKRRAMEIRCITAAVRREVQAHLDWCLSEAILDKAKNLEEDDETMENQNHPTPAQIKASRLESGLTQAEAARVIRAKSISTWQSWEYGRNPMPEAKWLLWLKIRP